MTWHISQKGVIKTKFITLPLVYLYIGYIIYKKHFLFLHEINILINDKYIQYKKYYI